MQQIIMAFAQSFNVTSKHKMALRLLTAEGIHQLSMSMSMSIVSAYIYYKVRANSLMTALLIVNPQPSIMCVTTLCISAVQYWYCLIKSFPPTTANIKKQFYLQLVKIPPEN